MSEYPRGAIRTYAEIDHLLDKARTEPVQIHCVWYKRGVLTLDKSLLDKKSVRNGPSLDNIVDEEFKYLDLTSFNIGTGFYKAREDNWYLFENYWFAYAWHLKLKEKGNA